MGRGEAQDLLDAQAAAQARSRIARSPEELNEGKAAKRSKTAASLTHPEELRAMWVTNQNAPQVLEAVLANPATPEEISEEALARLRELSVTMKTKNQPHARRLGRGMASNPQAPRARLRELQGMFGALNRAEADLKVGSHTAMVPQMRLCLVFRQPNLSDAERERLHAESAFSQTFPAGKKTEITRNDLWWQADQIEWAASSPLQGSQREKMLGLLRADPKVSEAVATLRAWFERGAVKTPYIAVGTYIARGVNGPVQRTQTAYSYLANVATHLGKKRALAICDELGL